MDGVEGAREPIRGGLQVGAQAAALATSLFVLYALGASRTIYVGDSGELTAAVHILGIPHPSGYPLYVLLGKLWTLLVPVGSIAFRMSLFSGFCSALACGGLYALARRLGLSAVSGLLSALLLAFAPSFWSQATVQRVYSLNALMLVVSLSAAVVWMQSRQDRWLILACFLAALGATNHTSMAIFALGLGISGLVADPGLLKRPRTLIAILGAGALGLTPYLYMPLRSRADPMLDWGNPESWQGLVAAIVRREAWVRSWLERPADLLIIGADYLQGLAVELALLGAVLALVGMAAAPRRRWPWLLLLLTMAGNFASLALHGSRSDIFIWHRYYLPSYVVTALFAGLGWQVVAGRWPRKGRLVVLLIPLFLFASGFREFDRSRYRIADDFSRTLLSTLPPGAHLSATDDNILFVLIYLHMAEGLRPDLDLILQGVGDADLPPLRFDPDRDPLYFTHHPNWSIEGLEIEPLGLSFQTVRTGSPLPDPVIPKWRLDGEEDPRVPKDYLTRNLIGHFHYMLGITFEKRDWLIARRELVLAATSAPDNDVLFYNLGLIYRRNGLMRRSLSAFERSHEINPRRIATSRPTRAYDRVLEMLDEVARLEALESRLGRHPGLVELVSGKPDWHRRLADLLQAEGEPAAAYGHRLLALEAEQGT